MLSERSTDEIFFRSDKASTMIITTSSAFCSWCGRHPSAHCWLFQKESPKNFLYSTITGDMHFQSSFLTRQKCYQHFLLFTSIVGTVSHRSEQQPSFEWMRFLASDMSLKTKVAMTDMTADLCAQLPALSPRFEIFITRRNRKTYPFKNC